jgi:hypothetical protein
MPRQHLLGIIAELGLPDFGGIVLHPARLREMLPELSLCHLATTCPSRSNRDRA